MKRRQFITVLGGVTGFSSLVVGTEAFNSTEVERTVSIAIVEDYSAFLKLEQLGSGGRSEIDGNPDELTLELPGDDEGEYPTGNPTNPEGVGTNSVYRFGRDAAGDENGLFGVTNQGTQPVEVYSTQSSTEGVPSATIFDAESGERLTEHSPSNLLDVGEQLICGLEIDTRGVSIQNDDYELSLGINATTV